jgi:hypothetical protein
LAGDQHPENDKQTGTVVISVFDMTCFQIVAPSGTVDSGQVAIPQAWVRNLGSSAVSCSVAFRISTGYVNRQYIADLVAKDSIEISFQNWTSGPRGTYAVSCSTELAGDQHPENDKQTGTVIVGVVDMSCLRIVAPSDTVDSGKVVVPQAWVRNLGSSAVSCSIAFRVAGGYLQRHYVDSLAAGESTLVSFPNWSAGQRGAYAISCSTELAGDQHPENDRQTGLVVVSVLDMTCFQIVAPSGTVDSGHVVTPQAWVKNLGSSAASCSVAFRIGTDYLSRAYVKALATNDSLLLSFQNWTAGPRGTYSISCSTELAGDLRPANDKQTGTVVVHVADMTCLRIIAPSGAVDSGHVVTPQAWVKNLGSSAASCPVAFRIGTDYLDRAYVKALATNESLLLSFPNWTAEPRGTYVFSCSTELTGDQHPENDKQTGAVTVSVFDMTCFQIVAPSGTVDSGQVVTPQAWVRNLGNSAASCSVAFRIVPGYLQQSYVTNLATGDSTLVSFLDWTAGPRDTYLISCSTLYALDQDSSNDKCTTSVRVRVTDVGVAGIVAPEGNYPYRDTVRPRATWHNYGTDAADFVALVELTDPKAKVTRDSVKVVGLKSNGDMMIVFSLDTFRTVGKWRVRCTTNYAVDMVPGNNLLSDTFVVETIPNIVLDGPKRDSIASPGTEPLPFSWHATNTRVTWRYRLLLKRSPSDTAPIYWQDSATTGSYSMHSDTLRSRPGGYWWRVGILTFDDSLFLSPDTGFFWFEAMPKDAIIEFFNFPNPFDPTSGEKTTFRFISTKSEHINARVDIYSTGGEMVERIPFGSGSPVGGVAVIWRVPWDGRDGHNNWLAPGVYLAQLFVQTPDESGARAVGKPIRVAIRPKMRGR